MRLDAAVALYRAEKQRRGPDVRMVAALEEYRRVVEMHPNSPNSQLGRAFMQLNGIEPKPSAARPAGSEGT